MIKATRQRTNLKMKRPPLEVVKYGVELSRMIQITGETWNSFPSNKSLSASGGLLVAHLSNSVLHKEVKKKEEAFEEALRKEVLP